jgi:hypothetical protein
MATTACRSPRASDRNHCRVNPIGALDGIGLAGAAISVGGTTKMVLMIRRTTGKSMLAILRGLNRQERLLLTKEILRDSNGGISNGAIKELQYLRVAPKRYDTRAINLGIARQLSDTVNATIGVSGSFKNGLLDQVLTSDDEALLIGTVNAYQSE